MISLLSSKDRFTQLAAAFDKKHVNVGGVDLTHSQYRYLLSSSSAKMNVSKSFAKIIEMEEKGKQVVMLCAKSDKRPIDSLVYIERAKLEFANRNIDKIDGLFDHCPKPLDFYDLAKVINTLSVSDFDKKKN